ncbi:hypothetical protein LTS10_004243 [Elasticomyces elasticus]|nr:hypothetical protein LTS10_004243 [Elasticomyces elasticus]
MVSEKLRLWRKKNKGLPYRRDSVFQLEQYLNLEVREFYTAFAEKYRNEKKSPKLAVITVDRAYKTRSYATRKEDTDTSLSRDKDGKDRFSDKFSIIVDRHITSRSIVDSYSHRKEDEQGTLCPARYVILKDECHFTMDSSRRSPATFRRATFKLRQS